MIPLPDAGSQGRARPKRGSRRVGQAKRRPTSPEACTPSLRGNPRSSQRPRPQLSFPQQLTANFAPNHRACHAAGACRAKRSAAARPSPVLHGPSGERLLRSAQHAAPARARSPQVLDAPIAEAVNYPSSEACYTAETTVITNYGGAGPAAELEVGDWTNERQ